MNSDISALSDKTLIEKLVGLSKEEAKICDEIVLHLIEVDKRMLYRDLGYSSLYAYCTLGLNFSAPRAKRRITAVRCMKDYPEVLQMFLRKQVSVSTICLFAQILTPENQESLLAKVAYKSQAEIEWICGWFHPVKQVIDRIVPITEVVSNEPTKAQEIASGSQRTTNEIVRNGVSNLLVLEERYKFEFSGSRAFKSKLDTVK